MAVSQKELEFNFNEDQMRLKISALEQELAKIITKESLIGVARLEEPYTTYDFNSVK